MPWSNGPAKNSGKMVIRSKRMLFACIQLAQAFWQRNINAPGGNINAPANILRQWHQQLARCSFHLQQRRACGAFAGEEDISVSAREFSNRKQPIRSLTKNLPAGSFTRSAIGIKTSSPRSFSAASM